MNEHNREQHALESILIFITVSQSSGHRQIRIWQNGTLHFAREKGGDLTQSYDKSPYTHRKIQKAS